MTHLRIELSSNNEIVTSSLITKLYELVYAGLDASSNLKGYITAPHAKRTLVEYLLNLYPELTINVTGEYYVEFADLNVEKRMMELFASGLNGILTSDVNRVYLGDPDFNRYHTAAITSFNELSLFTNIKTIDNFAFFALSTLTSINLSNIEKIGVLPFDGCSALSSLGNTSHINKIDHDAFNNCASLTSVSFPALTSLSYNTFRGCTGLVTASIPFGNVGIHSYYNRGTFYNCTSLELISGFTECTVVPSEFCRDCSSLTTIDLSSVTDIDEYAFNGCSSIDLLDNGLDFSKIKTLGHYCFSGCTDIGEVELPAFTLTQMSRAFINSDVTKISNIPSLTAIGGENQYNHGIFDDCLSLKTIDLSLSTSLTNIERWAVKLSQNKTAALEKVIFPSSITQIDQRTFLLDGNTPNFHGTIIWATSVPTMVADDGSSNPNKFLNYPSTVGVYVPHASLAAYQSAWSGMSSLIHSIKDWQWDMEFVDKTFSTSEFEGASFSSVIIKGNTTIIPDSCFKNAASLEHVQINAPVTQIGSSVFLGCSSLLNVDLSNTSITYIPTNFMNGGATNITIKFPTTITSIASGSFDRCLFTTLTLILPGNTVVDDGNGWVNNFFNSNLTGLKIYVPDNLVSQYESTLASKYAGKVYALSTYTES